MTSISHEKSKYWRKYNIFADCSIIVFVWQKKYSVVRNIHRIDILLWSLPEVCTF